jgi:phosphoribosylanthranilate isomerase
VVKKDVKVKICGITNLEDALCCQEAGADFLGFVFAKSPRRIMPDNAKSIISKLSDSVKIAALFVNEDKKVVDGIIKDIGRIDLLQFHGDETPDYCAYFKGKKIIKAFRLKDEKSLELLKEFRNVDFILLDSYSENVYGGTGKCFDLSMALQAKECDIPIFLSGGLNPDNVNAAIEKVRPFCVDVSSGVEKSPGKKDRALIKEFLRQAKGRF